MFKISCFFSLHGGCFHWESVEKLIKDHTVPLFLISLTMQFLALFKGWIWLVRGTTHHWLLTRAGYGMIKVMPDWLMTSYTVSWLADPQISFDMPSRRKSLKGSGGKGPQWSHHVTSIPSMSGRRVRTWQLIETSSEPQEWPWEAGCRDHRRCSGRRPGEAGKQSSLN